MKINSTLTSSFLFTLILLSFSSSLLAQNDEKSKAKTDKVDVKLYGFIRNYLYYDSRNVATVCGGDYHLIPYDEDWNITSQQESSLSNIQLPEGSEMRYDRNAIPQTHFQALSTRIGLALSGGSLLGAVGSGKLEADFAGFGTTNTVLRLRLAYMKLDWNNERVTHSLLAGQDWHPLSGDIMPEALGFAAGSPFRPHSRTPQLRYEMNSHGMSVMVAILYQYQYTTPGPEGESSVYANRSLLPEMFLGVGYRGRHIYTQLGCDITNFTVREAFSETPFDTVHLQPYLFKDYCRSFSPSFYFQYVDGKFSLKMRTTLAQNLAHLNMMSGYARVFENDDTTSWKYKPLSASVSYLDLAYGKKWRANLLFGYHKNLGLPDGFVIDGNAIYMKKGIDNINSIYRIAPSISYNSKTFNIGVEYEWTAVSYGDLMPDGTVADNDNIHLVSNHRICFLFKYNF